MGIKSRMWAEQSKLKDKISLLEWELSTSESALTELENKNPIPSLFFIPFLIFLSLFNTYISNQWTSQMVSKYWLIPLGVYVGYKIFSLFSWWDDRKKLKEKISEYKRHIKDLEIEYNTYGKVVEILFGEQ